MVKYSTGCSYEEVYSVAQVSQLLENRHSSIDGDNSELLVPVLQPLKLLGNLKR